MAPLSKTRSPIGISLDEQFITAAQLFRHGGRWRLDSAVRIPRDRPGAAIEAQEVRRLRDVLVRQGFVGRHVVVGLPAQVLFGSLLELPPRCSGAPVEMLARAELARMHDCDPHSIETACWDLPGERQTRDTTHVMALACPHEVAEGLLDAFEQAGLDVEALDSELHATARACGELLSPDGVTAILTLGWDTVVLNMMHRGQIVYHRALAEVSMKHQAAALAELLEVEPATIDAVWAQHNNTAPQQRSAEEAALLETIAGILETHWAEIVADLEAPFAYIQSEHTGREIERLLLTGFGAATGNVAEYFENHLHLMTQVVAPMDAISCSPALGDKARDPSLTVAVGLARFTE